MDRGPRVEKFKLIFCYHRGGKGENRGKRCVYWEEEKDDRQTIQTSKGYQLIIRLEEREMKEVFTGERELLLFDDVL